MGIAPASSPQPVFHKLPTAQAASGKKRVLFVCIGNSCRSQMAEGFARKFGGDFLDISSAGLSPAAIVQDETHRTMWRFGVTLEGQYPKGVEVMMREHFDVVVNMSGMRLPVLRASKILDWRVRDPIGRDEGFYETVAEEIERLVGGLVTSLRG